MKTHTQTTKALSKTIDATMSTFTATFHKLPRFLRAARKTAITLGGNAASYAKARPARVIAGLLLVGLTVRKLARRV